MKSEYTCKGKIELRQDDVSFFETTGFSMWPFLKAGEKLIIKKASIESLSIGDIILYRADHQIACHRLVRKMKRGQTQVLYARGDNTSSLAGLVSEDMFLGKVIGVVRKGRIISLGTRRQKLINRLLAIAAPLISAGNRKLKGFYVKFCKKVV